MDIPDHIRNDPRFIHVTQYIERLVAIGDMMEQENPGLDAIHLLCFVCGYVMGNAGTEMPIYIEALTDGLNLAGHEAKIVRLDLGDNPITNPKAKA